MKAIYQSYIDNIRKGIINPKELDALEEGINELEQKVENLESQVEELSCSDDYCNDYDE